MYALVDGVLGGGVRWGTTSGNVYLMSHPCANQYVRTQSHAAVIPKRSNRCGDSAAIPGL